MTADRNSTTNASDPSLLALAGTPITGAILANSYQVTPSDVLEMVSLTKKTAAHLTNPDNRFRNARLVNSSYDGLRHGDSLVATHGTAHAVVMATLGGVSQDLERFAGYLDAAVTDGEDADHLSHSMLEGISHFQDPGFAAAAHQEAVNAYVREPLDLDGTGPGEPVG